MKSTSKWLVPGFLRRLDQYLRERYPVIWYSGAHWALFYGLMGGVVLFGVGLFYQVHWVKRELVGGKYMNLDHWVVDPIRPIEFAYDDLYIYSLLLLLAVACIWMYRQFQLRPFFYQVQYSLFCLLIYVGCWWVLFGVTATAFRMGTIVKTAWIWMPERDLQDFKNSGVYPYGFVPLKEDSLGVIPNDTTTFFQKREKIFKLIWEEENQWLKHRYKFSSIYNEKYHHIAVFNDKTYVLKKLHLDEALDIFDVSDRSELSHQSDEFYRLSNAYKGELSNRTHPFYPFYRLNRSALPYVSVLLSPSDQIIYSSYYRTIKKNIIHLKALDYKFYADYDTAYVSPIVVIPSLPNQIEDAVRSVEHARQFLREGIFWRYFWHLPYYLVLIAILLLLQPWVSAKRVLPLSVASLLIWFGLQIFEVEYWEGYEAIWKSVHLMAYLLLPLVGLLLLLWMLCQQKQGALFTTAVNMVFLGVLIVLFGALNFDRGDTLDQFGSPIDGAFYGAQLIGLLAACIIPYVQAMPKTR